MIVTFYSYKGGVGRSMALANVAKWFQLQDLKVVMIDWDLEAPGLESFFAADMAEREAMGGKLGLIDLIATYRDLFSNLPQPLAADVPESGGDRFVKLLEDSMSPIRHFLQPIKPHAAAEPGSLSMLSAGCRSDDRFDAYAETVQGFDWAELYANFRGQAYFEWMRSQLNNPDFADIVMIDSRTGVAEMSGVCTRQLADVVVILCAPNDQNLDGVAMMARSFIRDDVIKARGGRPLELIIVPARVDVSEGRLVDSFVKRFQEKLGSPLPKVFERIGTDYQRLSIPYISEYSFSERLAVPDGAHALQKAYRMLASHIAALAPAQGELRRKCVAALQSSFGLDVLAAIDEPVIQLNNEQRTRIDKLLKALKEGVIDQSTFDTAMAAISGRLTGSGAIAQGDGGMAIGAGGVFVGGENTGRIHTGTQTIATGGGALVEGAVQVDSGYFIGRDFVQIITDGTRYVEDHEEAKSVIAHYLSALVHELTGLRLGEIDASADLARQSPLQLADIYVPLDTTLSIPDNTTLAQWLSRDMNRARDAVGSERKSRMVSALEALAEHRELTLLGKPGSGKTTFGANVLLTFAQVWQGQGDALAKLGESWSHGALLPIRVILRRFAEGLPDDGNPLRAGDLWAFIGRDLDASGYGLSSDTMDHVQRIARNQGALILLDGLDECGDSERRGRVLGAVQELMRSAGQACRFLLTARPYAWPGGPDPAKGVYVLAELNDSQIEQFIRAWYAALVKRAWRSPGEAERKMDDLLKVRQRHDLLPLAQSPLLLTLMTTLHTNRGRIPDDRADLYSDSVELLMLRWNQQVGADKALLDELAVPGLKLSDLREVLEELAFKIHEQNVGRDGAADIGEDRLVRAFLKLLNDRGKADVVVDYIEKRAGLLIGQGEKDGERQFTFPHRTFQEFLAASHLAAQADFPAACARLAREAPAHWQVVLQLAARLAKAERGASAADELIGGSAIVELMARRRPDAADWTCALLAGMQLQEIGVGAIKVRERTRTIATRVAGWLVASLPMHPDEGGTPASQRAQAGDVLAALGDPRFDPESFHLPADDLLGFMHILADPGFRIGTREVDRKRVAEASRGEVYEDEINEKISPTPEFYIARYPVTVAQFRAFVEDKPYEIGYADALRDLDNRPVRYVSWREALDYCGWLNEQLAHAPQLAGSALAQLVREGWRVALPSELEWEKAARGGWAWPIPGRANSMRTGPTPARRASVAPRQSAAFQPTNSACMTWRAMSMHGRAACGGPIPMTKSRNARTSMRRAKGLCAAALGTISVTSRVVPVAAGFGPAFASTSWGFGWCCVLPLFAVPELRPSGLRTLGLRLWRGCGGDFPRRRGRFFSSTMAWPGSDARPGRLDRLCAAALGTITVTTRVVPIATGINPTIATTTWGFGWCCVLPMFFPPFFWFRRLAERRVDTPCRSRSGNAGRSARAGLFAEAKEEEQRQTGLVRARAARRGGNGGIARAGHIFKPGHGQAIAPAVPAPTRHDLTRSAGILAG